MDEDAIKKIKSICHFSYEMDDGFCTSISFHDESQFGSTIRRNSKKNEIVDEVSKFKKLKSLNLRKCRLGRLPAFESECLEYLDISCNSLEKFPCWLVGLPLKFLNIGANHISQIPDLSSMPLETLKLHKNTDLSEMPSVGKNIKALNLFLLPKMNAIPEEVMGLRSLEVFSFGGTRASVFPDFSLLSDLKWLTLTVNDFERIHEEICSLKKLKGLCLAKNKIKYLPNQIGDLKSLEVLTLYCNRISKLPKSFFKLNLKKLNLSKNDLRDSDKTFAEIFGKQMEFFRI
jgi:Leucine-rich repeat (LRR) protein